MPAFNKYLDPNDAERNEALDWELLANNEKATRKASYVKAVEYYGREQATFLDLKDGEPDDNTILNVYRIVVDRMTGLLFPTMPNMEITRKETVPTPDEVWLKDAWKRQKGLPRMVEAAMNGAFSGQVYMRVRPNERDRDHPKLSLLDPRTMLTYWQWDDVDEVIFHEQSWAAPNNKHQYVIDYVNQGTSWVIKSWERVAGGEWTAAREDTEWGSPWGPVASWKHLPFPNTYYGLSEATALALGDTINLVMSEALRINRYHAAPKTIALGVDAEEIVPTAIDGLWSIAKDKSEADVFNLEFSAPAAAYTLGLLQMLQDYYLAEARAVMLKGDIKDFQRVTNPGIRTVFMDPLVKNELLRQHYTDGMQQISMAMAFAAGKTISLPTVIWSDPLPSDDRELVIIAKDELEMGIVSKTEVSEQRGYSYPEQWKLILEEAAATMKLQAEMGLTSDEDEENTNENDE